MRDTIFGIGAGGGLVGLVAALLRSGKLQEAVGRMFRAGAVDLAVVVENLKSVVEAQGESIEWLRTELDRTKEELAEAKAELRVTEDMAEENSKLRTRVAELEVEVAFLKEELKRRRGGRPRKEVE